MSTRHASNAGPLRQERYASSPEFERGLIASMVARRCSVLDDKADRELIWALQYLSHQEGGINRVVAGMLENCSGFAGTKQMQAIGKRAGQKYTADEVRTIRKDLPRELRCHFLLRGELSTWDDRIEDARRAITYEEVFGGEADRRLAESEKHPSTYTVEEFSDFCITAARSGISHKCNSDTECLETHIRNLCLDPGAMFAAAPWYFSRWIEALRKCVADWIATKSAGKVVTKLGELVHESLDYAHYSKSMTLVEGDARTGKSFSARTWCEQRPGQARFVEVPVGNDDAGFFRALARGLGIGSFQQYKAAEIRQRVESVLLTGDLLLCLDEAHRLWPEVNLWRGFPKRINWVMSMANQGVPICLIGTPQFIERQKTSEQIAGWNSAQFIGRLADYKRLPRELELDDLIAVAKSVLPEADKQTLRALAAYARTSARYLAAIDAIAKRARYIAIRSGRTEATTNDVRTAMRESVIPSDSNLVRALKTPGKATGKRAQPMQAMPALTPSDSRNAQVEVTAPMQARSVSLKHGSSASTNRCRTLGEIPIEA